MRPDDEFAVAAAGRAPVRRLIAVAYPGLGDAWDEADTGIEPCAKCRSCAPCACRPGYCECECDRCFGDRLGDGGFARWALLRWVPPGLGTRSMTRWHVFDPYGDGQMLCGVRVPDEMLNPGAVPGWNEPIDVALTRGSHLDPQLITASHGYVSRGGPPPIMRVADVCKSCRHFMRRERERKVTTGWSRT